MLEKATKGNPEALHGAVQSLLSDIINECSPIIFNGDGYSEEWHEEAAKRGLLNLKTTADALPCLQGEAVLELFEKYDVLSEREMESRFETYLEQYCMTVQVEANLTVEMAKTMILPAVMRYQNELASTCANLWAVGYEGDRSMLEEVSSYVKSLQEGIALLDASRAEAEFEGLEGQAARCRDYVLPAMAAVREAADELEGLVADDLWPLPTYQEMLFMR